MSIITGYDFAGWATKNDLRCADGRIIRSGAFSAADGKKVPLVWNHQHNSPSDVLGHAILENRAEGVYAYCFFNKNKAGQDAKENVVHGDVESLSIWANNLQQAGSEVLHGVIREVSLVLAGANPGAFIESVLAHGEPMEDFDDEGIFHSGEGIILSHSIDEKEDDKDKKDPEKSDKEDTKMDDNKQKETPDEKQEQKQEGGDKTVAQVMNTLNDEQKAAVATVIGAAIQDSKKGGDDNSDDNDKEEKEMKHSIFDSETRTEQNVLSHSDMEKIFADAKRVGSLREAVNNALGEGMVLSHSLDTTGMDVATGTQTYGFNDPDMLFPEYKSLNNPPEWISRNMDWVSKVLGSVHHTPFSRIKSVYADITEEEARAKGYIKGNQKKTEVFTTLKRETSAQMIYKMQKLDRQDIIEITDFDVVAWIKAEMRVMLNEEIARAILIGDGRLADAEDKISEDHIRPVVKDVPLFNVIQYVEVADADDEDEVAKALIRAVIKSRKLYKGSGNPSFFTTEDYLTDVLLLEDGIGHKLYKTEGEAATALRAKEIVTVEPMEGQKITVDSVEYPLIGTLVNLADYNVGTNKGGEINMFDDFDIDFNQYKYLIETMFSGALIKPFSAITFLLKVKA